MKEAIERFRLELNKIADDYNQKPIRSSYDKFISLVKEAIILQIICYKSFKQNLLDPQEIANYLQCLEFNEAESQTVLSAIKLWMDGKKSAIPYAIIFEFTRFTNTEFQSAASFLTYELSIDNQKFKRELLYTHYLLIKRVVSNFKGKYGSKDLPDDTLEQLFTSAILLYYCGYADSLRLPKSEGIRYTEDTFGKESIEKSFKDAFNHVGKITFGTHFKVTIALWHLAAIDLSLLILHCLFEIYAPLNLSPLGLQFTFNQIPVFLLASIVFTALLLSYLFRFENGIIKRLRGESDDET